MTESRVVLGRYKLAHGPPLGTGGWCVVRRAEDTASGQSVAVKTFSPQAVRQLGKEDLRKRFVKEVRAFRALGVAPGVSAGDRSRDPRQLLVNLLDYSRDESGEPGPDADGLHYTVLELADEPLDAWLRRRREAGDFVGVSELRSLGNAIAEGLTWLHSRGLCHLDVKPENIMRFGGRWKFIDLEGCQQMGGDALPGGSFTPLYASPEVARAILARAGLDGGSNPDLAPSPAMDSWAAGVVLLDVLSHGASFEETKAGFDAAALFDEEAIPFEGWYRWLADAAPIDLAEILSSGPSSAAELLRSAENLRSLLTSLLEKDPARRATAADFSQHPFLVAPSSPSSSFQLSIPERTPGAQPPETTPEREAPAAKEEQDVPSAEQAKLERVSPAAADAAGSGEAAAGLKAEAAECAPEVARPPGDAAPPVEKEGDMPRARIDAVFRRFIPEVPKDPGHCIRRDLKRLVVTLGLPCTDAEELLQAFAPADKVCRSYSEFLDFVFGP